jgi:lambda family phage portal protein
MAHANDSKTPVRHDAMRNGAPTAWDYRANLVGEIATWQPPLTSADNDIRHGFELTKARARDLALSNPYAANSVEILRDAVVGKKFMLALAPHAPSLGVTEDEAEEWSNEVEAEWNLYAEGLTHDADATRKSSFTFLMHQVMVGLHVDGEALGLVISKEGQKGYRTCLQLIEPERLDNYNQMQQYQTGINQVRFGVERDEVGEAIAYNIREVHPHETIWSSPAAQYKVKRVERYTDTGRPNALHLFDAPRPNMSRGVSVAMAASLKNMKMLSTFTDAELSRQIQSASWAAVIETEMDYEQAMRVLSQGGVDFSKGNPLTQAAAQHFQEIAPYYQNAGIRYNGAKVAHLLPGEKLQIVQSALQGAQYDQFEKAVLRQLAAGLNVSYESLARDYSGMSYSAARQSMQDIWMRYLRIRQLLTQGFAMPYFSAWLEEAIIRRKVPMLGKQFKPTERGYRLAKHALCQGEFISWGKPIIDPVKERTGQGIALALGLTTMRDEAGAEGDDWLANLKQRSREAKARAALDLNPTGIDPTLVVGGNAKSPNDGSSGGKTGNAQEGRQAKSK